MTRLRGARVLVERTRRIFERRAGRRRSFDRNRPLEGEFPYLWLDAKQLKVRSGGHLRSKALVVAYAVDQTGRREVIGIDLGEVESEAFWL